VVDIADLPEGAGLPDRASGSACSESGWPARASRPAIRGDFGSNGELTQARPFIAWWDHAAAAKIRHCEGCREAHVEGSHMRSGAASDVITSVSKWCGS